MDVNEKIAHNLFGGASGKSSGGSSKKSKDKDWFDIAVEASKSSGVGSGYDWQADAIQSSTPKGSKSKSKKSNSNSDMMAGIKGIQAAIKLVNKKRMERGEAPIKVPKDFEHVTARAKAIEKHQKNMKEYEKAKTTTMEYDLSKANDKAYANATADKKPGFIDRLRRRQYAGGNHSVAQKQLGNQPTHQTHIDSTNPENGEPSGLY